MSPDPPKKTVLLVNPWIHDFAAYDFWMKPLGLLYLGGILRAQGRRVILLDCLEIKSIPEEATAALKFPKPGAFGKGHFYKEPIPKPESLRPILRHFRRYGIPPAVLERSISSLPRPDLILVTSFMTYWYTGVAETVAFLRLHWPGVPIWLGGIYATLLPDHARQHAGADQVLPGPWDRGKARRLAEVLGPGFGRDGEGFPSWPYPVFDLYPHLPYACLLTRLGCPFCCTYCASSKLMPGLQSRSPDQVVKEILYWHQKFGIQDFAFYDDALLIRPSRHILPVLREIIRLGLACRFHAPNALHIKEIDEEMGEVLFQAGFKTLWLGLETADEKRQIETGGKVSNRDFQRAVRALKKAGFADEEIGVYILAGMPGQRIEEVKESMAFVREAGARPKIVEYSPIPGTPLFQEAQKMSPFDLANEPLFHNNSILPCQWEKFTWKDLQSVKRSG
jgi:pyruvate-formate lyase-activating enzyme